MNGFRDAPQESVLGGMAPAYDKSIKTTLKLNSPPPYWQVFEIVRALSILQNYFERHETSESLDMTIASTKRAALKIAKVPTVHGQYRLSHRPTPSSEDDVLDMYLYPNDMLDKRVVAEMFEAALNWIKHGGSLPVPVTKSFDVGEYSLDIRRLSPSTWTLDQLNLAIRTVVHVMGITLGDRAATLHASILSVGGTTRGEVILEKGVQEESIIR